jgi:hypothetical protein
VVEHPDGYEELYWVDDRGTKRSNEPTFEPEVAPAVAEHVKLIAAPKPASIPRRPLPPETSTQVRRQIARRPLP